MKNLKINLDVEFTKRGYYSKKTVKAVCNAIHSELKGVKECDELEVAFNNGTHVVSFKRNYKLFWKSYAYDLAVWFSTSDNEGNDYCTTAYCQVEKGKIDWEYSEVENERF